MLKLKHSRKSVAAKTTVAALLPADLDYIAQHYTETPHAIANAIGATVEVICKKLPYCVLYRKPWTDKTTGKQKGGYYYVNFGGQKRLVSAKEPSPHLEALAWEERSKLLVANPLGVPSAAPIPADYTVNDLIAWFLKNTEIENTTRSVYEDHLCNFSTGYPTVGRAKEADVNLRRHAGYGDRSIHSIDRETILEWWAANPTWSTQTCKHAYAIVQSVFSLAAKLAHKKFDLKSNPISGIPLPHRIKKARTTYLNPDQLELVLAKAKGAFRIFVEANLQLGTRPGELATVTPKHVVDIDGDLFFVLQPHEWKNGKKIKDKAKATRIVPITGKWIDYVLERMSSIGEHDPIFVNKRGKKWTITVWGSAWRTLRKRCNLSETTVFYTLRHTHITNACEVGIDRAALAEKCGTSIDMIQRVYDHSDRFQRAKRGIVEI